MNQNDLIESIAQGFRKSPEYTIGALTLLLVLVVLFLFIVFWARKSRQRQEILHWQEEFDSYIRHLDLSINELDLVDELARFLISPRRKILLLRNINTFFSALHLLEKDRQVDLRYRDSLEGKLFSSEDISQYQIKKESTGSRRIVRLVRKNGISYSGLLYSHDSNRMVLGELKELPEKELAGAPRLYLQDLRGFLCYTVIKVVKGEEGTLVLNVEPWNRKSPRVLSLQQIFAFFPGEKNSQPLELYRLNQRIATVENPGRKLEPGDTLKVSLSQKEDRFRVSAVVLKRSRDKKTAILQLGNLKKYS